MNCEKCGGEKWKVISNQGPLEKWRCERCGQELDVHVFNPKHDPPLPPNREPVYLVSALWYSIPKIDDVRYFHSLFFELKKLSVVDLIRMIRLGQRIEVGRVRVSEFEFLKSDLERLGVELTFIPIS